MNGAARMSAVLTRSAGRRRLRAALLAGPCLALAAAGAGTAGAATYRVHACALPGLTQPATMDGWNAVGSNPQSTRTNRCPAGGFELAGIVQSDAPLAGQLADMLTSFGGAITFEDGLYSIRAEKARSSVWTATDADIKALGEMQFEADAAVYFDAIKGVYYDAAGDGRRLTSPVQVLGGGARETSIDLPFVDSSRNAQVLVFRKLTYDRDGGLISITFSDAALSLVPTEVFTISSVAFPFANGNWQVIQIDVADVGCIVAARRYVSGAYVDPATYVL